MSRTHKSTPADTMDPTVRVQEPEKIPKPELGAELVHDPYSVQNPLTFKKEFPGYKFGWKGERHRGARGWRGWICVKYDDEIGRNLDEYIVDPPRKMEGSARQDNYVRRGDSILCILPRRMFDARQKERTDKAARRAANIANAPATKLQHGVVLGGEQDSITIDRPVSPGSS